ncbi:MFS transporter [Thermaurantiacus sp.]
MRVPTAKLLAWCGPSLPSAALGLPLVVYLPPHYSGTLLLPIGVVGLLFAVVRLVDIPLDPLLGALIDQTRTGLGRFRPWLLGGAATLIAGVLLLFFAPVGVSASRAFLALLVTYLGYSALFLAQTSWGSQLSPDYAERARIFGFWTAANVVGTLLVLLVPPVVLNLRLVAGPGAPIHAMGWFILAITPATALLAAALVPEGGRPTMPQGLSLAAARAALADRRMQLLLGLDLLVATIPAITGALFLFFIRSARGYPPEEASILLLFYFVAGLLAAPLWIRLATRLGKHRAVALAGLALGAVQLGVLLMPKGNLVLAGLLMALAGLPFAAPGFLLRAMLADLNDARALDRQRSGKPARDEAGLTYALLTATGKLGYAIPIGLLYPLLGLIGFDPAPEATNSDRAILGLTLVFIGPPFVLGLATWWLARRWPIDAAAHAAIRAELMEA